MKQEYKALYEKFGLNVVYYRKRKRLTQLQLAELVDIAKEIERLEKEEERLTKELARVNGMLANEKFVSKAPAAKIEEEKAKQAKYSQMMEQVKERLAQLR